MRPRDRNAIAHSLPCAGPARSPSDGPAPQLNSRPWFQPRDKRRHAFRMLRHGNRNVSKNVSRSITVSAARLCGKSNSFSV